ncbi:hypothetical protein [Paraburkholderia fungorum]|uniref:hypothetical protein n=1 Tax=Paraburkholderia fungorum TaxID=134537 RepID=UPI00115F9E42|nr:hypothetical protein [Paraburkholderia fungorum]
MRRVLADLLARSRVDLPFTPPAAFLSSKVAIHIFSPRDPPHRHIVLKRGQIEIEDMFLEEEENA